MDEPPALGSGDETPPGNRDLPVEARGDLVGHKRATLRDPETPRLVLTTSRGGVDELDLDTRRAQELDPSRRLRIRVSGTDDDARDPLAQHPIGAGRSGPLVGARLERHVQRRPPRARPRLIEGDDLRVSASRLGHTLTDDLSVAHDNRADRRLGVRGTVCRRG